MGEVEDALKGDSHRSVEKRAPGEIEVREPLSHAMDEVTWYNERGKHRQQRNMQEFVLRTSTQAVVPMEKRGEDRREAAKSKQKAREKMSEKGKESR